MEREQIIKALECCTRGRRSKDDRPCNECPYNERILVGGTSERQRTGTCQGRLMKDALSLIKELTEENEKLLNELKGAPIMPSEDEVLYKVILKKLDVIEDGAKKLIEENERLSAYNENLIKENTYFSNHLLDEVEQAKDLAISCTVRQMKERIKEEAKSIYLLSDPPKIMLELREDVLDQIARELESEVSNYDT